MSAGAALATLLLGAAVALLDLGTPYRVEGVLVARSDGPLIAALALALLAVPAAAFVHQVSRLAQATGERRLAALRLAGATPGQVRLIAARESGRHSAVGALPGGAAALAFAVMLGVSPWWTLVAPPVVVLGGVLSGLLAGRHVIASPLGLARRARLRQPRALDLALVLLGAGLIPAGIALGHWLVSSVLIAAGGVLLVFGLTLAATWLIRASAGRAGRRAGTAEALLAARLVEADPRAWARTLSVVGLTVFFGAAVAAQQTRGLLEGMSASEAAGYGLVYLALLVALVTSAGALVVHQAEELLDHRRSFAALSAAGALDDALGRVLTRQARIAATPVCAVAAAAGVLVVVLAVADVFPWTGLPLTLGLAGAMAGIGVLGASLVARLARPILARALRPGALHR
ncbi:hypothetical protein [Nonomuraea africana]|uniref:FtsX-like permease family protein n=1 Tax=Nonomuraea africana TaxID=46171 RepID=A0ABR9KUI2_9ACTN|nr:hypothetical protein [Nonomuraea africana]MBE1565696.1 hypothetical protein [Nonomuraea africana]